MLRRRYAICLVINRPLMALVELWLPLTVLVDARDRFRGNVSSLMSVRLAL